MYVSAQSFGLLDLAAKCLISDLETHSAFLNERFQEEGASYQEPKIRFILKLGGCAGPFF